MDRLFVCSYNCRTIASEASLRMLLLSSRLVEYDVIALQETKGRTENHSENGPQRAAHHRTQGGRQCWWNWISDQFDYRPPSRLAQHRQSASCCPPSAHRKDRVAISIINVYAPTAAAAQEEREEFYRLLEKTIRGEKSYYKYVVGDFNAVVGTNCTGDWRLGPHGFGDRTENGELLLNLLYACRLFHGNSMFEKPAKRRWTWESPNGRTHTEIDHVLTNRRWSLLDVSVLPSFDTGSDHRLVRAKILLNKRIFKRDTHRPAYFKTPSFDTELLESAIEAYDWRLLEDPTEDYEYLTRGLLKCADISRRSQPAPIPRLNALAVSLLEKRRALKQDPNANHLEKVIVNKACRMAVKESLREYRRTKLLKAAEAKLSIKRCKRDLNDQKAMISALLDKDGSVKTSRSSMENIVQDFYTELFRSSTFVPKCSMPPYEEPPRYPKVGSGKRDKKHEERNSSRFGQYPCGFAPFWEYRSSYPSCRTL
uniref:Endo/exonuclease/phosphatase domain-containing protein n=1 Tax=Haemonchus contortus TaxID=6289 RepID=A0A7I4YII4_HAECO